MTSSYKEIDSGDVDNPDVGMDRVGEETPLLTFL